MTVLNVVPPRRPGRSALAALSFVASVAVAALGPAPAAGAPPAAADAAGRVYRQYCQRCHGADGKGAGEGLPDFTRRKWQERRDDAQLKVSILDGKGTTMPAFRGRLDEAQAKALVAHVRAFSPSPPAAPGKNSTAGPPPDDEFEARMRQLQKELEDLRKQLKELDAKPRPPDRPDAPAGDGGGTGNGKKGKEM
jgi:mono/diheme cytochrome c family protein